MANALRTARIQAIMTPAEKAWLQAVAAQQSADQRVKVSDSALLVGAALGAYGKPPVELSEETAEHDLQRVVFVVREGTVTHYKGDSLRTARSVLRDACKRAAAALFNGQA